MYLTFIVIVEGKAFQGKAIPFKRMKDNWIYYNYTFLLKIKLTYFGIFCIS